MLLEEAEYFVALCGAESLVTTDEFENLSHTLKQRTKIEIIDIGVVLKPSESRGKSCHLQLADEPALDPGKGWLGHVHLWYDRTSQRRPPQPEGGVSCL